MKWLIRVCSHGHRIEFRSSMGRWQHMDSGGEYCDADREADRIIEVVERKEDPLRDLVATLWLYIGGEDEARLTTDQKELLADTVEEMSEEPMEYDRWWR